MDQPETTKSGSGGDIAVIVNGSGGRARRSGEQLRAELLEAFAAAGARIDPQIVEGAGMEAALQSAQASRVVAIGGGDGTIGAAAGIAAQAGTTIAVLPLGTLNHLAAQLGIPVDLPGAAQVAVSGVEEAIDLGSVNDVTFINNASIGIYAKMVRAREANSLPKWLATIPAAWSVIRRMRHRRIEIEMEGRRRVVVTPLLFVGNNRYHINGRSLGQRESLTDGLLSIYAVEPRSLPGLMWFALRALAGRADPYRDFARIDEVREFTVLGAGEILVAHDGEVSKLRLPLKFASRPGALNVMVPKDNREAGSV